MAAEGPVEVVDAGDVYAWIDVRFVAVRRTHRGGAAARRTTVVVGRWSLVVGDCQRSPSDSSHTVHEFSVGSNHQRTA